jgi:porin
MNKLPWGISGRVIALICMLFGALTPAFAQTTNQPSRAAPDTVAPTGNPNTSTPALPPPQGTSDAQASPFAGITAFGQTLKDKGIYLQLGYNEIVLANVSGGKQRGIMPTGELFFGTVLDFETMFGLTGSSFHITFDERNGYNVNGIVGTQGPLQSNSGPTRAIRLSEFFWEQGFDNDRFDPTADFATSDIACQFVSSIICAQPGTWYFSNNSIAYPTSVWGGRFNVALTPNVYVRAGVFDDDTSQLNTDQHGFNWNVKNSTGVFVPMEIGYSTTFSEDRYPKKYDIGGYYDAASYTTPDGFSRRNRGAFYLQGVQTVWRPNPATNESVTLFGGALVYSGGAPYWAQYYAGILDRGPFQQRPNDTIGVIGTYFANNSDRRPNKRGEWIFEVNYGFQVIPGVTVKPVMEYVISPNNPLAPVGSKQPSDAWIVGVQVALNVGEMFHFPQFVAH